MASGLNEIHKVTGSGVVVSGDDIDTDQIIPARYLRCVTFDDLASGLFHDARFDREGVSLNHPLDDPAFKGASILISDEHFGCGSSREHAPQAIKKGGFKAVIAGSFAEIFFGNATAIGLLCVCLNNKDRQALKEQLAADPKDQITICLEEKVVKVEGVGRSFPFTMPESARKALLSGTYDPLWELCEAKDLIAKKAASLLF